MLIDGKKVATEIRKKLKEKIQLLTDRPPCLAVILVGEDPASKVYVSSKRKACTEAGIRSIFKTFETSITEEALLETIEELNHNEIVDGILVQLPLPKHIDSKKITEHIHPDKDVDGFHPINVGRLSIGDPDCFCPCTPKGVQVLLQYYGIDPVGQHVVIVGRSNIVGKPLASLFVQKNKGANATVTIAHSRSKNLVELTRSADILIAAIGSPEFIRADMIKEGAVVIDVGVNRVEDPTQEKGYRLCGDVAFKEAEKKASAITPVPGGVGVMTIAMLLSNTWDSYQRRIKNNQVEV
ncbi:MAG: bifunctional methylenetetrahydrofolate dehydrogenase/methenyltetrahydrofolate cyclohydrolase FolD [Waddliaceae bacterium]|nr:bifunctional methylenetetrahydrofolate dehydrogenase/methenyltetrahydrofolate cyclohydrolase FolD [Waddliaceae bacterium]